MHAGTEPPLHFPTTVDFATEWLRLELRARGCTKNPAGPTSPIVREKLVDPSTGARKKSDSASSSGEHFACRGSDMLRKPEALLEYYIHKRPTPPLSFVICGMLAAD